MPATPQNESGLRGMDQGPAGRINAPQKKIMGPQDGSGSRETNKGPQTNPGYAKRIRALRDGQGPSGKRIRFR